MTEEYIIPCAVSQELSEYAFQCVHCRDLGFPSFYTLVLKELGPWRDGKAIDVEIIAAKGGLIKLDELEFEPDFSSNLNNTPQGYACDHCFNTLGCNDID